MVGLLRRAASGVLQRRPARVAGRYVEQGELGADGGVHVAAVWAPVYQVVRGGGGQRGRNARPHVSPPPIGLGGSARALQPACGLAKSDGLVGLQAHAPPLQTFPGSGAEGHARSARA
eukprot:5409633-Prymnesium_polylepis.2